MGPLGHLSVGLAAKPAVPKVSLGVLLLASWILDVFAIAFGFTAIERAEIGNPWSHGLFMSVVWSVAFGLLAERIYRDYRAGVVVGAVVFSHWVLDFISHPIPFTSFSWHSWQWSYGQPLPCDLPLLFSNSPRVCLGLCNSISAVEATILESGMFITSKRQLRQFQIESVKFVGTQVTDEESGAVGSNTAPGTSRTTPESGQGLQFEQELRASFADLTPLKGGMLAKRNIVVKVAPVG